MAKRMRWVRKRATLVLITKGTQVLLGYKKKGEIGTGTLNAPGGKKEPHETLLQCACREVFEEVGVEIKPSNLTLAGVIKFFAAGEPDFEVYVYHAHSFKGEPQETADMIPGWYDIEHLPFDQMLESDREWFPRALTGKKFFARVYYKKRADKFERIEFDLNP